MVDVDESEYEIVPLSPIRRLEKRLERLEASSSVDTRGIFREIIDIIRMNQQIVDELVKSSNALKIELSKLPGKLDELISNLKELITFIKTSGEEEVGGITKEAISPLVEKFDEMIKVNKALSEKNDAMLELLDEISKKIRRPLPKPLPGLLSKSTQPLRAKKPI